MKLFNTSDMSFAKQCKKRFI